MEKKPGKYQKTEPANNEQEQNSSGIQVNSLIISDYTVSGSESDVGIGGRNNVGRVFNPEPRRLSSHNVNNPRIDCVNRRPGRLDQEPGPRERHVNTHLTNIIISPPLILLVFRTLQPM